MWRDTFLYRPSETRSNGRVKFCENEWKRPEEFLRERAGGAGVRGQQQQLYLQQWHFALLQHLQVIRMRLLDYVYFHIDLHKSVQLYWRLL